jgi:hypothetical protein
MSSDFPGGSRDFVTVTVGLIARRGVITPPIRVTWVTDPWWYATMQLAGMTHAAAAFELPIGLYPYDEASYITGTELAVDGSYLAV